MVTVSSPDPRSSTRGQHPIRPLAAFFAVAYAVSWAWTFPLAALGEVVRKGVAWPSHYPALAGPLVAALAVTGWTAGRAGLRDLFARMFRWRVRPLWWLMALSPLVFLGVALLGLRVTGRDLPAVADFGRFSATPTIGVLGVLALITLVNGFGEETGWRGYALPELQKHVSPLAASLILAPLWALWHLPQFFVVETYRDFGAADYVGMLLGLSCGAVVLTWLYNRSGGSVLMVVIWHGVFNLASGTAGGAVPAVVTTLIMVQGLTLITLELLARHRGRPSVLAARPPLVAVGPSDPAARPAL